MRRLQRYHRAGKVHFRSDFILDINDTEMIELLYSLSLQCWTYNSCSVLSGVLFQRAFRTSIRWQPIGGLLVVRLQPCHTNFNLDFYLLWFWIRIPLRLFLISQRRSSAWAFFSVCWATKAWKSQWPMGGCAIQCTSVMSRTERRLKLLEFVIVSWTCGVFMVLVGVTLCLIQGSVRQMWLHRSHNGTRF